jgi:hypothetical protein
LQLHVSEFISVGTRFPSLTNKLETRNTSVRNNGEDAEWAFGSIQLLARSFEAIAMSFGVFIIDRCFDETQVFGGQFTTRAISFEMRLHFLREFQKGRSAHLYESQSILDDLIE